ncbi:MAG: hypothetical protein RBS28_10515 [Rhodocyclaceae bacterium]|jgi:hypothetical protein|nr:hypothetical protein [Rhodocyclaceae bacterium]
MMVPVGLLRIALALAVSALAGCATAPEPPAPPVAAPAPVPAPAPQAAPQGPVLKKETVALLARRGLKPITGRALNAKARCSFRDDTGYAGRLDLSVRDARVEALEARVDVPRRGSCNFRLADFRQTESLPIVVLASPRTPCKVSLWEQGEQVTVAFRDCRAECGGDAVNYLWPILVDNQKGSCS